VPVAWDRHSFLFKHGLLGAPVTEADQNPPLDDPAYEFRKTEALSGRASTRKVKALIASMTESGWNGPPIIAIEIRGKKYILNGHHRVHAARMVGIRVPAHVIAERDLLQYGYSSTDQVVAAHVEAGPNRIRLR
jgi:hypothetical protein